MTRKKFKKYKPLRTFSEEHVCFPKYRQLREVTSVDLKKIRALKTRKYLLIRLYESCNILKENFVLDSLDIAIPVYIEPHSA